MPEMKLPESIDNALGNVSGKVTETAGDLFDAALTYVGRNVIKKYKFSKTDDIFELTAYQQAQTHALKLQEIKNQKIQDFYGEYIDRNIFAIASKALELSISIPEKDRISPDVCFIGSILEDAKYQDRETLQEMYATLLASSIDLHKTKFAHPSFGGVLSSLSEIDAQNIRIFFENSKHSRSQRVYRAVITTKPKDEKGSVSVSSRSTFSEILFIGNSDFKDLHMQSMSLQTLFKLGLIEFHFNEEKWYFEVDSEKEFGAESKKGYDWIPEEVYTQDIGCCNDFFKNSMIQNHLQELVNKESNEANNVKTGTLLGLSYLSPYGKRFMEACGR